MGWNITITTTVTTTITVARHHPRPLAAIRAAIAAVAKVLATTRNLGEQLKDRGNQLDERRCRWSLALLFRIPGVGRPKAVEDVFAARLLVVVNAMSLPIMGIAA